MAMAAQLRSLPGKTAETATRAVKMMSFHAAERAERNAPIKTGRLRAECRPLQVVAPTAGLRSAVGGVVATAPWAFKMHEFQMVLSMPSGGHPALSQPPRAFPPTGIQLRRGPRTQAQPGTPEGGAGGKYIERVLNYHADNYHKFLAKMVKYLVTTGQVAAPLELR